MSSDRHQRLVSFLKFIKRISFPFLRFQARALSIALLRDGLLRRIWDEEGDQEAMSRVGLCVSCMWTRTCQYGSVKGG